MDVGVVKKHKRYYTLDPNQSENINYDEAKKLNKYQRSTIQTQIQEEIQDQNQNQYSFNNQKILSSNSIHVKKFNKNLLKQTKKLKNQILKTTTQCIQKVHQIEKQHPYISLKKIVRLKKFKNQNTIHLIESISNNTQTIPQHGALNQTLSINISNTKYVVVPIVAKQLKINILDQNDSQTGSSNWDFKWTDTSLGPEFIMKMKKHQRINYFIGISSIARKNLLMENLYKMKDLFPDHYDFFPETFQYPKDIYKIKSFYQNHARKRHHLTFIVKPQASCQGRGIYLSQKICELDQHQKSIVQQYIQRPMLYQNLKFDFRVYFLLRNVNPLQLYIYKQGLVRFATERYTLPSRHNLDDLYMHLTNYAINKNNPKYKFNNSVKDLNYGHKKSLAQFFRQLSLKGVNTTSIWRSIKDIAIKTILSVQPKAQPKNQGEGLCYQILGFDFMLDQSGKVYLLEVNQSPSFSTETPLDFLVKNYLIKDTLKMLISQKLKQKQRIKKKKNIQSSQKQMNENRKSFSKTNKQKQRKTDEKVFFTKTNEIGNYQLIFPKHDNYQEKQFLKILKVSKAQYYKCSSLKIQNEISSNSKNEKLSIKHHTMHRQNSPQLKVNSKVYASLNRTRLPSIVQKKNQISQKDRSSLSLQNKQENQKGFSLKKERCKQYKQKLISMRKYLMSNSSLQKTNEIEQQKPLGASSKQNKKQSRQGPQNQILKEQIKRIQQRQQSIRKLQTKKNMIKQQRTIRYLNPLAKISAQRKIVQSLKTECTQE